MTKNTVSGRKTQGRGRPESRRRAAVAVTTAVTVPVIIAFAALSVDVGVMYNAKADLQRTADAAALSAAARLTAIGSGDRIALARQTAKETALANLVLRTSPTLTDSDIVFGKSTVNPITKQVTFVPSNDTPDSVRVRVRKTADSPNGALPLYFARIFGRDFTDVEASATAAIAPRDIAIVSDVSGSLVYDSTFRRWQDAVINLYDVWAALPGGAGGVGSVWGPSEVLADPAQSAGPAYGYMKRLGFGDDPADQENYNVSSDPGLVYMPSGQAWSNAQISQYLADQSYSTTEINAIMNYTSSTYYENRVALALGLATWNSGISGGRWQTLGLSPVGNGNTTFADSELSWTAPYLSKTGSSAQSAWRDYIYRTSRSSSPFPAQFGVKTWLDYTLEHRRTESQTPELASIPVQPMQSIKDATRFMMELLTEAESFDQISLETYSTSGTHKADLTHNFMDVIETLDELVPSGSTNMGAGMERGIEELLSHRSRGLARKVMLLITDGEANIARNGSSSVSGGKQYALEEAQRAADLGIQIIAISVGQGADQNIMAQIAQIGKGVHFHSEGTIEQYSAELLQIFAAVGGRRTVELLE